MQLKTKMVEFTLMLLYANRFSLSFGFDPHMLLLFKQKDRCYKIIHLYR